ncbi:MAG: AraC family transcriptional regulator [Clostridia bacterium]|nr:MAG: AraC family transcriptional regulator [Clostridia bacterium]
MKDLRKRVAYLRGLMDGLQVNTASNEGRVLGEVVSILEDMSDGMMDLYSSQDELEKYVESVDEDLSELEDQVNDEDFADDDDYIEVECPQCHDTVYFDPEILDDDDTVVEVTCPNCGAVVFSTAGDDSGGAGEGQEALVSSKTTESGIES